MLKVKSAVMAAFFLTAIAIGASAQNIPDGKIVVLNTTAFPNGIFELKQKYDQVENQFKQRSQELESIAQQMQQIDTDVKAKGNVLPADKLREMQDRYEALKREGTRKQEDLKNDYDKALESATKPVRDKLYQFLNNYTTKNSITMVINLAAAAQSGTLAFWDPKSDVTEEFINEYNKANPVPGMTATPPAGKPATNPATKPTGKPNGN